MPGPAGRREKTALGQCQWKIYPGKGPRRKICLAATLKEIAPAEKGYSDFVVRKYTIR